MDNSISKSIKEIHKHGKHKHVFREKRWNKSVGVKFYQNKLSNQNEVRQRYSDVYYCFQNKLSNQNEVGQRYRTLTKRTL
jgi:hypothetical protein